MSMDLNLAMNGGTSSTATSVSKCDDGTDIRLRRQAKNKLKKEESKRVREEELRRKLCEPKDQRIRLVKRSELENILNPPQVVKTNTTRNVPNITLHDFPSLGKSKTSGTRTTKTNEIQQTPSSSNDLNMGKWPSTTNSEPQSSQSNASENSQDPTNQIFSSSTPGYIPFRKPKRNAPIKIEVLSALKKSKSVANVQGSKHKTKKDSQPQLSGNLLDSSNPTRNKGKKREVPKEKKPTSLKLVILQDRETKRSISNGLPILTDDTVSNERLHTVQSVQAITQDPHTKVDQSEDISEDTTLSEESSITTICDVGNEEKASNKILSLAYINLKETGCSADPNTSEKLPIHSRKFREYCNHMLSAELDSFVSALVRDVVKFQDRLYIKDPIKAHAKRRFVLGFRESRKYLDLKRVKLLIIAPDLERVQSAGGIDDTVDDLKKIAVAQEIPCVFALGRKVLKKLTNKSFKISGISCMGVLNYEGTQDNFNAIAVLLPKLQTQYQEQLNQGDKHLQTQSAETEDTAKDGAVEQAEKEKSTLDVNSAVVASFLQKLTEGIGK